MHCASFCVTCPCSPRERNPSTVSAAAVSSADMARIRRWAGSDVCADTAKAPSSSAAPNENLNKWNPPKTPAREQYHPKRGTFTWWDEGSSSGSARARLAILAGKLALERGDLFAQLGDLHLGVEPAKSRKQDRADQRSNDHRHHAYFRGRRAGGSAALAA